MMQKETMLKWNETFTPVNRIMFVLYIVVCCIPKCYASDERTVQCILGRNVSFSLTFNNINDDTFVIYHGSSPFVHAWPVKNQINLYTPDERLQIIADKYIHNTVTVHISIMNVTKNDTGTYKLKRRLGSDKVIDSVRVQVFATFPWIRMVPNIFSDPVIVLQCSISTTSTGNFIWKLNGSVIESHSRYSQNISLLSIRNVTYEDKYNLYTCHEFGSGLESDPFKLNISGPNIIQFATNVTVAKEYDRLNISCFADCSPVCIWNWSKRERSSVLNKSISTDNELQLKNITREDAGSYSCKVYNIISNTLLEGITYLDVVYGPDEISINTSETTIQLDEFDTIAILCYADCFPPCQISWTETNTKLARPGAELKLTNVEAHVNYTCHATNPRKNNETISETIYIKVTSGKHPYKTTVKIPESSKEDFPSARHFYYIVLGMGIILAVGLLAFLLHKCGACSPLSRSSVSIPVTNSTKNGAGDAVEEESLHGNYWTIVSDEAGEMSTAPDTFIKQCIMPTPKGKVNVPEENVLEQSIRIINVNVAFEPDEDIDRSHSFVDQHDDYINPVLS